MALSSSIRADADLGHYQSTCTLSAPEEATSVHSPHPPHHRMLIYNFIHRKVAKHKQKQLTMKNNIIFFYYSTEDRRLSRPTLQSVQPMPKTASKGKNLYKAKVAGLSLITL